jgi:flagellar biosynthesis protein FlhA
MAVDADLNAGLIDEKEAKRRRAEVAEEANFFGSMDGASKFVRGDAIAGILILFINIVGGFAVGMLQHNLSASKAADTYIVLAIGDALVAQIPGLLISVAAAMVISRVGKDHDMGRQIVDQLFMSPKVLGVTATILILLGLIPGMPHVVFLTVGGLLGYGAWLMHKRQQIPPEVEAPAVPVGDGEATWDDLQPVDLLGLELGYRLISLVDKSRQGPRAGQPRTQAQRLPHHAARCGGRRRRSLPRHVPGHQPRRHRHATDWHSHHRPRIWPACALDRRAPQGSRANGRFYRR